MTPTALDPEPWETNSYSAHLLGERSSERVNRYSRFKPQAGYEQDREFYDSCRACGGSGTVSDMDRFGNEDTYPCRECPADLKEK